MQNLSLLESGNMVYMQLIQHIQAIVIVVVVVTQPKRIAEYGMSLNYYEYEGHIIAKAFTDKQKYYYYYYYYRYHYHTFTDFIPNIQSNS